MKSQKRLILFIASAIGLYVAWFILYDVWLSPHTQVDTWLNNLTAKSGATFLKIFGLSTEAKQARVFIDNQPSLRIGNPCNGLEFFALFAGFIIIFPGSWKDKLWFIPVGIILVFLLNISRVAILVINYHFSHHTFDFNHKYTYSFFIYIVIFGLWMLWVNKFSLLKEDSLKLVG